MTKFTKRRTFSQENGALEGKTFGAVSRMNDIYYMRRVLKLALKGTGKVSPNPRVGALLVRNGEILSEGYHAYFGGPHAEVTALSKRKSAKKTDDTLYVNLEPCDHQGKTPPCTELIINSGVRRVVIGALDPNPMVHGKGVKRLREAGIDTRLGVLERDCIKLNEAYFKSITSKKPFITLKIAQTLDGKIATDQGHSRWISSEASRRWVHRMRNENDAILVGVNTVIVDDPELTVRLVRGHAVKKIVLDSRLRIPLESRVLVNSDPTNTYIATTPRAPSEKIITLQKMGVNVWILEEDDEGMVDFSALLKKINREDIQSVLVEGGNKVFTRLLCAREVDRLVVFIAPKLFGKGIDSFGELGVCTPDGVITFSETFWHHRGTDIVFEGRL